MRACVRASMLALIAATPALAAGQALYEVGENDRALPGSQAYYPAFDQTPELVLASPHDVLLVVWSGQRVLGVGDVEVRYQFVDARSGTALDDARSLFAGSGEFDQADGVQPSAAYDPERNEFLIVFSADVLGGDQPQAEFEIVAQRIDAATGDPVGDRVRISDFGPEDNTLHIASLPRAVYNPIAQEYLAAWLGYRISIPMRGGSAKGGGADDSNVFVQRLDAATLAELGSDDFRINANGNTGHRDSLGLAIAHNADEDEYLVVWSATTAVAADHRIVGQRLLGDTAEQTGDDDFDVSGGAGHLTMKPSVAYNPVSHEYLVIWSGENAGVGGLVDEEREIFGQRLLADGAPVGAPRFRISGAGGVSTTQYAAIDPRLAYDEAGNRYLAVWTADDIGDQLADDEFEIYAQLLGTDGSELGEDDMRISDMGDDGDPDASASTPAVVAGDGGFWASWQGDEPENLSRQIHLQRLAGPFVFRDGFESG